MCERLLAHGSSLGLYAEELDARTGRHLGNFPQAFTHLALLNAVMHVISQEEAGAEASSPPGGMTPRRGRRIPRPVARR